MGSISGSVTVTGFIAPTDTSDTYPVLDPLYGIDGLRSVADHTTRNAIPNTRRRVGMLVYTQSDGLYWQLTSSPWTGTDADWVELVLGGSGTQGPQGSTGSIGPQGYQGFQGLVGVSGPQGVAGTIGPQGTTGNTGPQGASGDGSGPQGNQGFQGVNGSGSTTYVYTQSSMATSWAVTHNLNKYPSITILDNSGVELFGEISYIDTNNITINYSAPVSGTAYLN